MQKVLMIINDAPYGTEKSYNALRLAMALQKEHREDTKVAVFLLADGVFCGLANQKTPTGYYNIERMLKSVLQHGGEVNCCGGCMEARSLLESSMIDGVAKSNVKELAQMTVDSDKVLCF